MKKIKLVLTSLTTIGTTLATVVSCSNGETAEIGATVYKAADPFMTLVNNAMKDKAKELGTSINIQDSAGDQAKQNEQIDSMISAGAKGLAINLQDPAAGSGVIDKAKENELPLVLYNKEISKNTKTIMAKYDKVYYVGTRSAESGEMQAELIYDDLKAGIIKDRNNDKKLGYYVLSGEAGHADAIARTEAVRSHLFKLINENGVNPKSGQVDNLETDPTTKKVHIKSGLSIDDVKLLFDDTTPSDGTWTDWSEKEGKDQGAAILAAQGNKLDFFPTNNDGLALGVANAAKEDTSLKALTDGYAASAKIDHLPIYGIDATAAALKKIKEGWIAGTVLNDAKNQGSVTVQVIKNLIDGKEPLDGISSYTIETDTKAIRVPYVKVSRTDDKVKNA